MSLTAEQEKLDSKRQMTLQRPASYRGHRFVMQSHMLSGGTFSECWYRCECGASYDVHVNLSGPSSTHQYTYSQVLFDCPLAPKAAAAPSLQDQHAKANRQARARKAAQAAKKARG